MEVNVEDDDEDAEYDLDLDECSYKFAGSEVLVNGGLPTFGKGKIEE